MEKHRSCGALLFRKDKGKLQFLLIKHPDKHWDFPKGHRERSETEVETVKREIMEETGITNLEFIKKFRERIEYTFEKDGKRMEKEVLFFLAQVSERNVRLSGEHIDYKWCTYNKALRTLSYENTRNVLKKAMEELRCGGMKRKSKMEN